MIEQVATDSFRLDRYLERIGYDGAIRPNLATLAALHAAHVDAIPFEAFDPFLRRPVKLDLLSVQDKLVDHRRGGYCFEQNALFKAALESIGFEVIGLGARVRWMSQPDSALGPKLHMALRVELSDGPYLADVGFGACVLDAPLQFKSDVEQRTAMGTYALSEKGDHLWLNAKQPGGWRTMYAFDLQPQIQSDYELGNWFTSTNPLVPFPSTLILERVSSDRRYKLKNRKLTIEARDGEVTVEHSINSAEELHKILAETFNVIPPAPVDEIFTLISE
jgi:N-hydroxyarylamine O-acetyltransferase